MQPERERVRAHFRDVVAELRAKPSTHPVRTALIDTLATYGERGAFPTNRDFVDRRMPYFVDATGVRCAVAHLMHTTGDDDLVSDIARHYNNALVPELAGDPRLHTWLAKAGFDAHEAARIQPTYCFTPVGCICAVIAQTEGSVIEVEGVAQDEVVVQAILRDEGNVAVGERLTVEHVVPGQRLFLSYREYEEGTLTYPVAGVEDEMASFVQCEGNPVPLDDARPLLAVDRFECRELLLESHPDFAGDTPPGCSQLYEDQPEDEGCAGGGVSWLGFAGAWALRRARRAR